MKTTLTGRGGPRPGSGRPKGSLSKIAEESRQLALATGELPHQLLLRIARGEVIYRETVDKDGKVSRVVENYDFEARKSAAVAAAPYYAPKISTVEVITGVNDDELDRIIKELAAQTGTNLGNGGEEPSDEEEGSPPRSRRAVFS